MFGVASSLSSLLFIFFGCGAVLFLRVLWFSHFSVGLRYSCLFLFSSLMSLSQLCFSFVLFMQWVVSLLLSLQAVRAETMVEGLRRAATFALRCRGPPGARSRPLWQGQNKRETLVLIDVYEACGFI